ncbi:sensor histidine kinase [Falsiroseomonas oryziterrae]|uniref:sensor histidine kinase n=1 Tax=Falsiroseomonas oryziterrae TaxID=2911368 RepID=UPI001F2B6EBC|nr:ATP-binding protein [Roseomonas sp. NPKOSM-4]
MPQRTKLARILKRSRALPGWLRYLLTVLLVGAAAGLRLAVDREPLGYPFGHLLVTVVLAAALFNHGAGLLATGLSAVVGVLLHMPPSGSLGLPSGREAVALVLFLVTALTITVVMEALHRAVANLERAQLALIRAEQARRLILREFRHRTRNDLGSLVGLLMLRARVAPSDAAREALREAADHALALARVHARLALDEGLDRDAERVEVCTRDFVHGLCADIEAAQFGQGLRPVRLAAAADAHVISAERAVPLGLVLNETVTNALKYAFPEDRPGLVAIRFTREEDVFVLHVADDGIGLPPEGELEGAPPGAPARDAGLGTRLLRALAAQLRGRFDRRPGDDGRGTVAELRFPVVEPGR